MSPVAAFWATDPNAPPLAPMYALLAAGAILLVLGRAITPH